MFITWTGIPTDATVGQKIVNSYLTIAGIVHCHITNSLGPSRILLLRTFMVLKKVVTLKRRDELMLFIKGLVVFSIYNLYSCNVKLIFTSLTVSNGNPLFRVFLFYYYLTSSDYFNDLLETVSVSSNGEQINLSAHGVPSSSLSMHDLKFSPKIRGKSS